MNKIAILLEKAFLFQKRAALEGAAAVINNTKSAIQSELTGGINNLNKLITTNSGAAQSGGIQALDNLFGRLVGSISNLNPKDINTSNNVAKYMLEQIAQVSFFTSPNNAGTGYDPITRMGGAHSPAAYMNRIRTHLVNMTNYLSTNKPPTVDIRDQNIA